MSINAKIFPGLSPELFEVIVQHSEVKEIPADVEILREGQYVKVLPLVAEGLIKVFTRYQEKELLLYYIKPGESCIMSFAAGLRNEPSRVFAITEEPTTAMLVPVTKIPSWINQHPDMNQLFFEQYNQRYSDLLDTVNHVLFDKMDKRLLDYLTEKTRLTGKNPIKISHRQIAAELGTAREVISRLIKKLENEGELVQQGNSIELLKS